VVEGVVGELVVGAVVVEGAAVLVGVGVLVGAAVDEGGGGGITLKVTEAPQSASDDPLGQQPASVQ
jgi:hypothetical protein